MKKLNFILYLVLIFCQIQKTLSVVQAFTKVPIVDLIGNSVPDISQTKDINSYYNNLPICGQTAQDCRRMHQLLFNEKITIVEQKDDEVAVQISSVFYEPKDSLQRNSIYWSLKKNFITIDELKRMGISQEHFPDPIDYNNDNFFKESKKKIAVLISPFWDCKTGQLFSVGTRFVIAKTNKDTLSVYIFDPKKSQMSMSVLPLSYAHIENFHENRSKKKRDFVLLLKKWSNAASIIPYVLGGCSYTHRYADENFKLLKKTESGKERSFYERSLCFQNPKNGFDCTGLVFRAAHICGIPYYYKNSTTVIKNLRLVTDENFDEGDLIWIPGHIMVIADKKNNTLIEARGYDHGYGKLQEIALEKVFKNISTFSQLFDSLKKKKQLQRLNSKGDVVQHIDQYKILKLDSLET